MMKNEFDLISCYSHTPKLSESYQIIFVLDLHLSTEESDGEMLF